MNSKFKCEKCGSYLFYVYIIKHNGHIFIRCVHEESETQSGEHAKEKKEKIIDKKGYQCVFEDRIWNTKPDRIKIVAHFFDDHQGNLSFMPDDQVFMNIEEIEELEGMKE